MHVSTQFSLQPHDLCYDFCPIRSQLAEHEQEINDLEFKMEKVSHVVAVVGLVYSVFLLVPLHLTESRM